MANVSKALIISFLATTIWTNTTQGCTIFIANDGKNVWVGNNEDDSPNKNYRLWFVPAQTSEYGYMVWGGILKGLAEKISHKFPEGGMNEHGLFIDAAALPQKIAIQKKDGKKDWKGYVIRDVLKKCKTTQEALAFLENYNLVEQEKAQLFIADATGDYAIVHANYVLKKDGNNFALTNYCLNDGEKHTCWRRGIVSELLKEKVEFGLENVKTALEKSAQTDYFNKTNFSIAADLKQGTVHLFQKNDFTTSVVLNVKEAVQKDERSEDMANVFPKNIAIELEKTWTAKGINAAVEQYKNLKNTAAEAYNFKNNDLANWATQLISQGKNADAKAILDLQPENETAQIWAAIASKLDGKTSDFLSEILKKRPTDYLANLFGNQQASKVTFYLDRFEDAQIVLLAGDFTTWKDKAIPFKKENGKWVATVEIPKGEHQYKFVVDGIWMTDPNNLLTVTENKNVNSRLIAW